MKDRIKDYHGAIADYEQAIALDPEDAIAYNNKGLVEEKLGRMEKAKASFKRADALDGRPQTETNTAPPAPAQSPTAKATPTTPAATSKSNPNTQKVNGKVYIQTLKEVLFTKKGFRGFIQYFADKASKK